MVEATDADERSMRQTQGPVTEARAQTRIMSPTFEYAPQPIPSPGTPVVDASPRSPGSSEFRGRSFAKAGSPEATSPSPSLVVRDQDLRKSRGLEQSIIVYLRRFAWGALAYTILACVVLVVIAIAEPRRCRDVFRSVLDGLTPGPDGSINSEDNSMLYQEWYADVDHTQLKDPFSGISNEATVSPPILRSMRSVSISINDLSKQLPSTDLPLRFEIVGALATCEAAINSTTQYIWNFENHVGDMADDVVKVAESTEIEHDRLNELRSQSHLHRDTWIMSNILIPYLTFRPHCARHQWRQTQLLSELVQDIARRLPSIWREGVAACDNLATLRIAFDNVQTLVRRDGRDTEDQQDQDISEGASSWYRYSPGRFYNNYLVKKQLKKLERVHGIIRDASKQTDIQMERFRKIAHDVAALGDLLGEKQRSDGAESVMCSKSRVDPPEVKQLNEIVSMIKRVAEDKGRFLEY